MKLEQALLMAEERDKKTGNLKNIMNRVYLNGGDQVTEFQINQDYLFFQEDHQITYFELGSHFFSNNLKKLRLEISQKNYGDSKIKEIRMSCKS